MKTHREKRQTDRQMCSDFISLAWADQNGRRLSDTGLLEDVSPGGVCVSMKLPVGVGYTVYLHTRGFEGEAEVRYCNLGEYGYLVGLEFINGTGWDQEKWRPKHLLEVVGPTA